VQGIWLWFIARDVRAFGLIFSSCEAPRHLLANNFGMPEKSIANFNRKRMVISAAATPT
jgi:hypothetical protein